MAANYYDVLNVSKDADSKAISEAYKKMALKWHPDKNRDNIDEANQRFKQIAQAYQVLSDSKKRLQYDRGQSTDRRGHAFFDSDDSDDDDLRSFFDFISPEMVFHMFFQQAGGQMFGAHHSAYHPADQRNSKHNRKATASHDRREDKRCENHIRMVNGKEWTTKTYYEHGKKIVSRYEDGELISKQINGVFQKIKK